MTGEGHKTPGDPVESGEVLDWVLGELAPERRAAVQQRIQRDPAQALEAAEVRVLLEQMATLKAEPSGTVELAVRYAMGRRRQLRRHGAPTVGLQDPRGTLTALASPARWTAQVAAVAALVLACLLLWQSHQPQVPAADELAAQVASQAPAPRPRATPGSSHRPMLASTDGGRTAPRSSDPDFLMQDFLMQGPAQSAWLPERPEVDVFTRVVRANHALEMLRLEFRQRYSRKARRQSIRLSGGDADLEDRIQDLADSIAVDIQHRLESEQASVFETAMALRALLASGSTLRIGHHRAVRTALEALEAQVAQLEGGELASALAALTDVAVVTGGRAEALVAVHADHLARSVLLGPRTRPSHSSPEIAPAGRYRPALLQFQTPVANLADAGHVLGLAAAFGVHPVLAHRARLRILTHLEERLAANSDERPDLLSALLYGFGDLVDQAALDQRMRLWPVKVLVQDDMVALHHLLWSQYPPRAGWARFQRELSELATMKTPGQVADASALLLSLAMNFAAPGVNQVLHLAG